MNILSFFLYPIYSKGNGSLENVFQNSITDATNFH